MPESSTRRLASLSRFGPPTLIVLGSLWLLQSVFAHTGSHGVLIRNLSYDAGTVKAGSTVTDNVRLINLSSQPVEVNARPGCGCTVADVPERPLAPLHSEIISLTVDTEGIAQGSQERDVLLLLTSGKKVWAQIAHVNFSTRR